MKSLGTCFDIAGSGVGRPLARRRLRIPAFSRRLLQCIAIGAAVLWSAAVFAQPSDSVTITNLERTLSGWRLGWESVGPNSAFTLQYQDTLQDQIWRVPAFFGPLPSASRDWLDTAPESSRFYRVLSVPSAVRGRVLSGSYQSTLNTNYLALVFGFGGVSIQPLYNVRLYKLVYETVTPLGAPTTASGALCVPENAGPLLPLVSYQHGTITETNKAPSSLQFTDLGTEVAVAVAFATSGYCAVAADYLGLGDSPGLHPYHHARSEATACVDMLRATRMFAATNSISITNRVFLCGYSQGGHATMALLRELEMFHTNEFTVGACAPMAGAYDLSGVTTEDFLSDRPKPNPYYFLYLLAAYQNVYGLAPDLASLLAAPYNTRLPPLMAGNSSGSVINAALPTNPIAILKPEYLAEFRSNPRQPLRLALQDNDVYRWSPKAPLIFYHCDGDTDVVVANTQVAVAYLNSIGRTDVTWDNPSPGADHGGCVQPSLLAAKQWFDLLR